MKKILYSILFFFCLHSAFAQNIETSRKKDPVNLNGSFGTTLNFTGTNDTSRTITPFVYYISGTINTSVYGISFPISYTYSKNRKEFSHPFYRIGVSPEYKWAKLHLGYRSINFSRFSLGGHNFLGGGLELNPGLLRFGAVYGRFAKKRLPSVDNPLDTIAGFSRKGYGLKLGLGNENNFFDLLFMRISDDTTTLSLSNIENAQHPQSNSVAGIHTRFNFAENFVFEAEGALSAFVDNVFAASIDEAYFENPSFARFLRKLDVNQSAYYATAFSSVIQYKEKDFSLGLRYRRIDPGYRSMGAYYFTGDIENFTLDGRVYLLQRKLSLKGSLGLQNNNLKENKKRTTAKVISKLNVSYKPNNTFGVTGNITNYSIDQRPGRLPLNDTIKLYQVNKNFSLNPYLMFVDANGSQMLNLNINLSDLNDRNPMTSDYTEVQNRIVFLNYSRSLSGLALSYAGGLLYNNMETFSISQNAFGGNASISKRFYNNKLVLGLTTSVQRSKRNNDVGLISNLGFNSSYRLMKKHAFQFRMMFTDVSYAKTATSKSYNRYRGTFSYRYSF